MHSSSTSDWQKDSEIKAQALYGFRFKALGCDNEIQIYAESEAGAKQAADGAIGEVRRIEERYSRYLPGSIVSEINASAGGDPLAVDSETAALLNFADAFYAESAGLFDITSGVLRRAWDFARGIVPSQQELAAVLPLVGWDKAHWDPPYFGLPAAGMEIDFGGIGKEYAVDRACSHLQDSGIKHGLVNLGGDIRVIGPHLDGTSWRIGLRHPRIQGATLCSVDVEAGAVASSGDYERFIIKDGVRYSHILHPRTGWPVSHLQSASVLAPTCLLAGAFATLAMLRGPDVMSDYDSHSTSYLFVDSSGELRTNIGGAKLLRFPDASLEGAANNRINH